MRSEVLKVFRLLHRTCRRVFENDQHALTAARLKIRSEFLKHKDVSDPQEIAKLVAQGLDAEQFIRSHVIQAVQTNENSFRIRIRDETKLEDNPPLPTSSKD